MAVAIALGGCAGGQKAGPALSVGGVARAPTPRATLTAITPALVAELRQDARARPRANPELDAAMARYQYRIGPQDVLTFIVWDHPELTIPAGEYRSPEAAGHKVDNDGKLFFPYVGEVEVAGRTLGDVRLDLTKRLEKYISRPQLDVRVAAFRSQKVLVTGEVHAPGLFPVTDVPLTVAEAINLAGGGLDSADLTGVVVVRAGHATLHDVQALLDRGDRAQDLLLQDGDTVLVPDSRMSKVHLLGEVRKPGSIPMPRGRMNLADAIGAGESFDPQTSDPGKVFVIRGAPGEPQVYWLDARSPEAMVLAAHFPLQAQDVVYVAHTSLATWNRMLGQLLPTINALYQLSILERNFSDSGN
jgi:polysaccharide export outer membrane protein